MLCQGLSAIEEARLQRNGRRAFQISFLGIIVINHCAGIDFASDRARIRPLITRADQLGARIHTYPE